MLRTSDPWLTSHLSQQTSKPAYYIVDCAICSGTFISFFWSFLSGAEIKWQCTCLSAQMANKPFKTRSAKQTTGPKSLLYYYVYFAGLPISLLLSAPHSKCPRHFRCNCKCCFLHCLPPRHNSDYRHFLPFCIKYSVVIIF